MATFAGLLTGAIFLVVALNFVPGLDVPIAGQVLAVVALSLINVTVWGSATLKPTSPREVIRIILVCSGVLAAVALVDTAVGFVGGERTLLGAFIHSGPFGGIIDAVLFVCGVLIGIPTLVRSLCLYYRKSEP